MNSDKINWQPKIIEPKFLVGQLVYFVRENQIQEGHIYKMSVTWIENCLPLIKYQIYENDKWYTNSKIFHSIDSLSVSLKEEFENKPF